MSLKEKIKLNGVIPATLLAFNNDFEIDEKSSRKHIRDCALTNGISAITVNGHSSEIHACSFDEQKRILNFSLDEVGDITHVINGIYADGSIEAAKIAKDAHRNGTTLKEEVVKSGILNLKEYDKIMSPMLMTKPK